MNVKRINARANINYVDMVKKITDDKSMNGGELLLYLCKELTVLQKYILELLLDRVSTQIKVEELLND